MSRRLYQLSDNPSHNSPRKCFVETGPFGFEPFCIPCGGETAISSLGGRIERPQDSEPNAAYYDKKLTVFKVYRALLNDSFRSNIESCERWDEARFEKKQGDPRKEASDEVQVCQDIWMGRSAENLLKYGSSAEKSKGVGIAAH